MIPVPQDNDGVGVVDVIEAEVGIHGVVDDQSSTETVDVLGGKMRVVLKSL
jgi:hypothetical protein